MNILFAASEITPVIKSGGLADVVGALPKHLDALGVDVRVVIPDYPQLQPQIMPDTQILDGFSFRLSDRTIQVTVRQTFIPGSRIKLFLLGFNEDLSVPILYPSAAQGDQQRFPIFCQAVLAWLETQKWQPDIIHVHDWMTSLIPYLVERRGLSYKTVITIHNLAYQGVFPREVISSSGITPPTSSKMINLLKTGILFATKVNTVSPTYAKEVMTREYGHHLEASMRQRAKDFVGILNGVDYARYAPYADKALSHDYNMKTVIESKILNKEMLRKEVKLSSSKKPLFGVVSRIDSQKGLDLVESMVRETPFMEHAQLVVLGTGSKELERKLARLAKRHPGQFSLLLRFDEGLAHRIYAASDFFLVPSRFEPCGLTQMIAMKYGTLPVVRHTGGLADTVTDAADKKSNGTGFVFNNYDYQELWQATSNALTLFDDKPQLYAVIEQAMRQDFSWGNSARQYVELYKSAIHARRRHASVKTSGHKSSKRV